MIQSNKDLYQKINEIIDTLKNAGHNVAASQLEEALSISTVPSEVLGETRMALMDINSSELPKQLNIENEIQAALDYLNGIF